MSPDDPRHGTYAGWAQHDRDRDTVCEPCLNARRTYGRVRPHLAALGRSPKLPAGRLAHQHAVELADLTEREWADHTGMSANTRRRILAGGPETIVRRDTRQRLEALNPDQIRAAMLTNIGCVRRLRALACLGHSATSVAGMASVHPQTARMIQGDRLEYIEYETRARIAAVYAELAHKRLAITNVTARAFNLAERSGWFAPLAWDNIDDPAERPHKGTDHRRNDDIDPVVVERFLAGEFDLKTTRAERIDITRRWQAQGRSLHSLEKLTPWKSERYVAREDAA